MKNVDYTEIADKIRNVSGGMYYHFGIASEILAYLQNLQNMQTVKEAGVLSLQLNVDGVPVSKSTNGQFWPVLGKIDKPLILLASPLPLVCFMVQQNHHLWKFWMISVMNTLNSGRMVLKLMGQLLV